MSIWNVFSSNVTPTFHSEAYPAISVSSRPDALNKTGKNVLITGASAGLGLATAKAFIAAQASTVIITGRRQDKLDQAVAELQAEVSKIGNEKKTEIIAYNSDVADKKAVDSLWDDLKARGIVVHILVLNAARFAVPKPLFELGTDFVWQSFEVNVRAPLQFAERFAKQGVDEQKYLLNVSTSSINMSHRAYVEMAADRPEYGLTKASGTLAMQYVAQEMSPDKMQVLSYHPGILYTDAMEATGMGRDALPFQDVSLGANFAVWASTKEAAYLHGRFVWCHWDVNEFRERYEKRLAEDVDFLRVSVHGLHGSNIAKTA